MHISLTIHQHWHISHIPHISHILHIHLTWDIYKCTSFLDLYASRYRFPINICMLKLLLLSKHTSKSTFVCQSYVTEHTYILIIICMSKLCYWTYIHHNQHLYVRVVLLNIHTSFVLRHFYAIWHDAWRLTNNI
jgi:hypothetical protein